jgi:hypothetical protein
MPIADAHRRTAGLGCNPASTVAKARVEVTRLAEISCLKAELHRWPARLEPERWTAAVIPSSVSGRVTGTVA